MEFYATCNLISNPYVWPVLDGSSVSILVKAASQRQQEVHHRKQPLFFVVSAHLRQLNASAVMHGDLLARSLHRTKMSDKLRHCVILCLCDGS